MSEINREESGTNTLDDNNTSSNKKIENIILNDDYLLQDPNSIFNNIVTYLDLPYNCNKIENMKKILIENKKINKLPNPFAERISNNIEYIHLYLDIDDDGKMNFETIASLFSNIQNINILGRCVYGGYTTDKILANKYNLKILSIYSDVIKRDKYCSMHIHFPDTVIHINDIREVALLIGEYLKCKIDTSVYPNLEDGKSHLFRLLTSDKSTTSGIKKTAIENKYINNMKDLRDILITYIKEDTKRISVDDICKELNLERLFVTKHNNLKIKYEKKIIIDNEELYQNFKILFDASTYSMKSGQSCRAWASLNAIDFDTESWLIRLYNEEVHDTPNFPNFNPNNSISSVLLNLINHIQNECDMILYKKICNRIRHLKYDEVEPKFEHELEDLIKESNKMETLNDKYNSYVNIYNKLLDKISPKMFWSNDNIHWNFFAKNFSELPTNLYNFYLSFFIARMSKKYVIRMDINNYIIIDKSELSIYLVDLNRNKKNAIAYIRNNGNRFRLLLNEENIYKFTTKLNKPEYYDSYVNTITEHMNFIKSSFKYEVDYNITVMREIWRLNNGYKTTLGFMYLGESNSAKGLYTQTIANLYSRSMPCCNVKAFQKEQLAPILSSQYSSIDELPNNIGDISSFKEILKTLRNDTIISRGMHSDDKKIPMRFCIDILTNHKKILSTLIHKDDHTAIFNRFKMIERINVGNASKYYNNLKDENFITSLRYYFYSNKDFPDWDVYINNRMINMSMSELEKEIYNNVYDDKDYLKIINSYDLNNIYTDIKLTLNSEIVKRADIELLYKLYIDKCNNDNYKPENKRNWLLKVNEEFIIIDNNRNNYYKIEKRGESEVKRFTTKSKLYIFKNINDWLIDDEIEENIIEEDENTSN